MARILWRCVSCIEASGSGHLQVPTTSYLCLYSNPYLAQVYGASSSHRTLYFFSSQGEYGWHIHPLVEYLTPCTDCLPIDQVMQQGSEEEILRCLSQLVSDCKLARYAMLNTLCWLLERSGCSEWIFKRAMVELTLWLVGYCCVLVEGESAAADSC